jgi:site-specific DNA-methyltransferase (adenine-specific)
LAIFDPQHSSNLDALAYGNEGHGRAQRRAALPHQSVSEIAAIGQELRRVIKDSGYVSRWCNTFELLEGLFEIEGLMPVAMTTWDNGLTGMGGRVRTCGAHLVLMQKAPIGVRAANLPVTWKTKPLIRAVHYETIRFPRSAHPHKKPVGLTAELILAVSEPNDVIIDPAAGDFTTMHAALGCHRRFLGCDLIPWEGRS